MTADQRTAAFRYLRQLVGDAELVLRVDVGHESTHRQLALEHQRRLEVGDLELHQLGEAARAVAAHPGGEGRHVQLLGRGLRRVPQVVQQVHRLRRSNTVSTRRS